VSSANSVYADGWVFVGDARFSGFASGHAFRWTAAGGMVDLDPLGIHSSSTASGVSSDGSIVVGGTQAGGGWSAFRWTAADGMILLGGLGGSESSLSDAKGISADGRVIVGRATDSTASGAWRAFRWTAADGMITVEQWLRNNGITVASDMTTSANATNRDGSVVVGQLENGHAFVARVSGLIDIAEFNTSLAGAARLPTLLRSSSDLVLNGAHGSPMRGLLPEGRSSVWTAGDWGRSDRNARNDEMATGEVGWSRGLAHGWQVKLAVGKTYDVAGFATGGEGRLSGTYVLPEAIWNVAGNLHATFSGYYNQGEADVRRGYLNAGTQTYSSGNADINVIGGRLRLDWLNAFALGGVALTPYTSLTSLHTKIDGYTETGGGFAAQWNKRSGETNILRAGVDAVYPLALSGVTLLGRVEGAWRAEENGPRSTGQTLGLGSFDFADSPGQRAWLRGSLGAESSLGGGILSLILNGTSHGGSPDYSLAANYRVDF
jgi:probable HAF family extracellular repeat protein